VAVGVVDRLEVIEVDEQQRAVVAMAAAVCQALAQAVEQEAAIGQVGERVDEGEVADRLLGFLAFGDVDDDAVQPLRLAVAVDDVPRSLTQASAHRATACGIPPRNSCARAARSRSLPRSRRSPPRR
jgi:hypothetical protein